MTDYTDLSEEWLKALDNPSREVLTLQIMLQTPDRFDDLKREVLSHLSSSSSRVKYDFLGAVQNERGYPVMAFEVPQGTGVEMMVGDIDAYFERAHYGYFICNKASGMHL